MSGPISHAIIRKKTAKTEMNKTVRIIVTRKPARWTSLGVERSKVFRLHSRQCSKVSVSPKENGLKLKHDHSSPISCQRSSSAALACSVMTLSHDETKLLCMSMLLCSALRWGSEL